MLHFERRFRLWDYRVSHDQLLIRSSKNGTNSKNVDVSFVGVEYVEMPTHMQELTISAPTPEDHRRAMDILAKPVPAEYVFVVVNNKRRYVLVAAAMFVQENELEFMESSLERF